MNDVWYGALLTRADLERFVGFRIPTFNNMSDEVQMVEDILNIANDKIKNNPQFHFNFFYQTTLFIFGRRLRIENFCIHMPDKTLKNSLSHLCKFHNFSLPSFYVCP